MFIFIRLIASISQLMNRKRLFQNTLSIIQMLRERKDQHINFRQEQPTQDNGSVDLGMAMEYKYGQMVQDMKVNGETTEHMGMASSFM